MDDEEGSPNLSAWNLIYQICSGQRDDRNTSTSGHRTTLVFVWDDISERYEYGWKKGRSLSDKGHKEHHCTV